MNEKYREKLEKIKSYKHSDLSKRDYLYPDEVVRNAMEAAINESELQDISITSKHISASPNDTMRATMMWVIYYGVEKLGLKKISTMIFPLKPIIKASYVAVAWIDTNAPKDYVIDSYSNYMTELVNASAHELKPWYDRLNIHSMFATNTTCYNRYDCDPDMPLTNIYRRLMGMHLSLATKYSAGCHGKRLISLFRDRSRNFMSINYSLNIHLLEVALVKFIASVDPKDTINWLKSDKPDIVKESQYLPPEILAEAFYCASYTNPAINNLTSSGIVSPEVIISQLTKEEVVTIGKIQHLTKSEFAEFKPLMIEYGNKLGEDMMTGFNHLRKKSDMIKTIENIAAGNYSLESIKDVDKISPSIIRKYIYITDTDSEQDIKTKLNIRSMLYYDILSFAPSVIKYMVTPDGEVIELPIDALEYTLVHNYITDIEEGASNDSIEEMVNGANNFILINIDRLDVKVRSAIRDIMGTLESRWRSQYLK